METPGPPVTHHIDSCPRSAQICRLILSRIFYHIRYCSCWPKSRFWWGSLMTSSKKGRDPHSIWTSPAISSPNLAWLELDGIDLTMPIFDKKRAMVDGQIHGFSPLNKKRARHKDCNKHKLTRKYLGGSFNLLPWRCWIYYYLRLSERSCYLQRAQKITGPDQGHPMRFHQVTMVECGD